MHKTIEIIPYNEDWPEIYAKEASIIKEILQNHSIGIHHIGSTSVPGLCSKRDIDILCIIDKLENSLLLEKIGYIFKDEFNIPFRYCFSKNTEHSKVNLHVVEAGHGFISLNLAFRDYLRNNHEARDSYAGLKQTLIKDPKSHQKIDSPFTGYNLGKNEFIKDILKKAKFDDLIVNLCTHNAEWNTYHRIRKEQIFDPINVEYNPNHPSITTENHYHFVLYKGTDIVTVAHVELVMLNSFQHPVIRPEILNQVQDDKECFAALRSLATDEPYKNKGYGRHMMTMLEKWIGSKDHPIIKMHSNLKAEQFYRNLGYTDTEFEDPCINPEFVNLGKILK